MDKLEAMNAFVKVVALGSYSEAGRALGLTRSAVSKAVMELEQLLGARLLDRTTRRVSATEAGLAYFESCVDILARVEETEMQVSRLHDEPTAAQDQRPHVVWLTVSWAAGRRVHVDPCQSQDRADVE
jgi:DNA-binding transcriptional LysR family regulator